MQRAASRQQQCILKQQCRQLQQPPTHMLRSLGTRLLQAAAQQAAGTGAAGGASSWAAAAAAGTAATAGAAAATTAQPAAFGHARRLAAAYVQRAGIRTKHAKHALNLRHAGGRATPLRRALRLLGRAAGATAVGVPLAGVAALAWKGREEGADVWEVLHSLPRTARIVWWGGWATWKVRSLKFLSSPAHAVCWMAACREASGRLQRAAPGAAWGTCRLCSSQPDWPCLSGQHARSIQHCSPTCSPDPSDQYKALAAAHGGDTSSVGYQQGLSELHQHAATKLLLAVQANGGIYIKASQVWGTACLIAGCCCIRAAQMMDKRGRLCLGREHCGAGLHAS